MCQKEGSSSFQCKKASDFHVSASFIPSRSSIPKVLGAAPPSTFSFNNFPKKMHLPLHHPYVTLPQTTTFTIPVSNFGNTLPIRHDLNKKIPSSSYPDFFFSGEWSDELAEVLDATVGMLQDLEQNHKDALRNAFQMRIIQGIKLNMPNQSIMCSKRFRQEPTLQQKHESKLTIMSGGTSRISMGIDKHPSDLMIRPFPEQHVVNSSNNTLQERILTRSAFTKALQTENTQPCTPVGSESPPVTFGINDPVNSPTLTAFDVKGLERLYHTFTVIDNSVVLASSVWDARILGGNDDINVLNPLDHGDACEMLLQHAQAEYDRTLLPGSQDILSLFTYPLEICSKLDEKLGRNGENIIRKSRHLFTSAEDNLLLRGVVWNMYGEKEWSIVSDRFMPDRGVNVISQRHARLCLLLYEAHGIHITDNGTLDAPHSPTKEDLAKSSTSHIKPATAPFFTNVLRWSLDEDITIMKAVPVLGHAWAEIASRLIPHRERGHLRKRYQVLERRVKATDKRVRKIHPIVDQSKPTSEVISKAGWKKTAKSQRSQLDASSAKSRPTPVSKTLTVMKEAINPTFMATGNVSRAGKNPLPLNQTLSKGAFPNIRPIIAGPSFFGNQYPKYAPHGFTARPAPPNYSAPRQRPRQVAHPPISHPLATKPSYTKQKNSHIVVGQSISKLRLPLHQTPFIAPSYAHQRLAKDSDPTSKNQYVQITEPDKYIHQSSFMSQEQGGKQALSCSSSPSSFHFSSPSSVKLSQVESINSPSWLTPRDSVVSFLPNGNTNTSIERLMDVEGLSKIWSHANNSTYYSK